MVSANFPNRPFALREHVWLIGQEINNNRSLVGFQLWIDKLSYSPTYAFDGIAHRWMKINGGYVHEYYGNGFDFRNGNNFLLAQGEVWVPHNADGTKNFIIEAAANFHLLGATSLSTPPFYLPTIPRTSNPSFPSGNSVNAGSTIPINMNRQSTSFTHDVYYAFGTVGWTAVAGGVTDQVNFTPPLSLLNEIPNSASGTGSILVYTISGGTVIGSAQVSFTLTAGAAIQPDFTTITHSEGTIGVAANIGAYVQSISKLVLAITGAVSSGYGATVSSYRLEVINSAGTGLQTINAVSGTTSTITSSGNITLRGTVTDSRGRSKQKTVTVSFLPYASPTVPTYSAQRALSSGVVDEDQGTYVKVNISAAVQSLIVGGTQKNQMRIQVLSRVRGTTSWTLKSDVTYAVGTITYNSFVLINTYLLTTAYDIQITVTDDFRTSIVQVSLPVASIFMHFDANLGVGIGKFREQGALDVAGSVYISQRVFAAHGLNQGTTAERDAYFGVPSGDTAQVALANLRPKWFNTTLGYEEMYIARTAQAGLTVPGMASGTFTGWKRANFAEDWAVKSGPVSYSAAYTVAWSRGMHAEGSTILGSVYGTGIMVLMDGIYECFAAMRGNGADDYVGLALSGNRTTMEDRSTGTSASMTGGWTHDHTGGANNFTTSYYLGKLFGGELVTAGPPATPHNLSLGSAASFGMMKVRRVS